MAMVRAISKAVLSGAMKYPMTVLNAAAVCNS